MSKEAVLQIPRLQVLNEITISFNELAKAWNLKEKRYGETTIQHFISRNKDALDFLEIEASCSPDSNRLPRLKLSTSKYVGSVPIVSPENGLPIGNIYVGGRFDEDISELLSVIGDFIPPDFNIQMELSGNFVKPPLFFECQHYIDEYIEAKRYKWRKFDNEEKIQHHPSSSTRWDKYAVTSADPHKVLDYAKPEGFCDEAWKAIYQYVFALAHGAGSDLFYYGDWIRKPGVAIVSCNDGLRPVIMKLEATDIDANLEYVPVDR